MKKIYIIGPCGSGKSTLARNLSSKLNIKHYELDCLVYDDLNEHKRRSDHEIDKLFSEILESDSFIIEDVGRNRFSLGKEKADVIYYIKLPKIVVLKRVITRWYRQKIGKESYNYPPTILQLIDMLKISFSYFRKEKRRISYLEPYSDKVIFLDRKKLNILLNDK